MELPFAFKNRDMLMVQQAMLSAMTLTGEACLSRGAALLADPAGEAAAMPGLKAGDELKAYRYLPGNGSHRRDWVRTDWDGAGFRSAFEPVRALPGRTIGLRTSGTSTTAAAKISNSEKTASASRSVPHVSSR